MLVYNALYRKTVAGVVRVMDAPVDRATPNALWEAQRLANMIPTLAAYGCGGLLWPPLTMSQSGATYNADGYGKQYDLNVGQHAGRPIRWGTAAMILLTNQIAHMFGMLVFEDSVIHQMDGGNPARTYYELDANGKVDKTLLPKLPENFVTTQANPVFDPEGNYSFGDLVYFGPDGYMLNLVVTAMNARKKWFALDGFREDDAKGETVHVTKTLIEKVAGWSFAEVFTGNPQELMSFVQQTGARVLDFTTHFCFVSICNFSSSLRAIPGNGYYAWDAAHAVQFPETADTDGKPGEAIVSNKLWAYLFMTTIPSAACLIYAGDYERYGLAPAINQIMWVSEVFAYGELAFPYVDDTLIVWTRDGNGGAVGWSGGLMCAFSTEPIISRSELVLAPFGPNQHLQDYLGHGPDLWTNEYGWVQIMVGPNVNGSAANGVAYSKAGLKYKIPIVPKPHNPSGDFITL